MFCLKKTGVITFPDPPEALSDCILARGDQEAEEFTAPGQSHQVPIKIRHPRNEKELTFTADVTKIKRCPSNTTLENTEEPTPSNKDQNPAPKSTNHANHGQSQKREHAHMKVCLAMWDCRIVRVRHAAWHCLLLY